MDLLYFIKTVVLGIVEGLTEFLPVSSTGHLILAGHMLDFNGPEAETFYVAIQAGAIVAVCWHYRARIIGILCNLFKPGADQRLAVNTVVALQSSAAWGCSSPPTSRAIFSTPSRWRRPLSWAA